MGFETPAELRAALREFINLKEAPKQISKIKELERAMVGRAKDGLDFFPTPGNIGADMVETAGIKEGMSVLEPSAGMGHIAEQIRAAGVDPDVVEMSNDRRELLEAKGFRVVGRDFMDIKPREFFTFGDTFKAPDGTVGVMRGLGGMGSNRVRLVPDEGGERVASYHDRDELVPVRKNGTESGYDRIIMNPPFSDRRDAEHVQHAFTLLKPGGRLVAIMGEGVFFGQDKKAVAFREWLDSVGGTSEKMAEGTFLDPSLPVNTGVSSRMVVIDKGATDGLATAEPKAEYATDDHIAPGDFESESLVTKEPDSPYDTGPAKAFYSKLQDVSVGKFLGMKAQSVEPFLLKNGVKKIEIETTGLREWLAAKKPTDKVTQHELSDFVKANTVELEDVMLGGEVKDKPSGITVLGEDDEYYTFATTEEAVNDAFERGMFEDLQAAEEWVIENKTDRPVVDSTHFSQYTEPGAVEGSYREMFVTVKHSDGLGENGYKFEQMPDGLIGVVNPSGIPLGTWPTMASARKAFARDSTNWSDGHGQYSEITNPIVRIRFNEVTGTDGRKILRVEEMQGPSPENQAKMPGSLKENIYNLGVKRILAYAKENGFDGVALATKPGRTAGETQADRYSLEKQVERVEVSRPQDGSYSVYLYGKKGDTVPMSQARIKTPEELAANIGKELAAKVEKQPVGTKRDYTGLDLKIGGEGLKTLYDTQLPRLFEAYGKEKMGEVALGEVRNPKLIHSPTRYEYSGPVPTVAEIEAMKKVADKHGPGIYDNPYTGQRDHFQINLTRNSGALRAVLEDISNGKSVKDALIANGVAGLFGAQVTPVVDSSIMPYISLTANTPDSFATFEPKQMSFNYAKRTEVLTQKQEANEAKAIADTTSHLRGLPGTVLGNKIAKDFQDRSKTNLIGQKVDGLDDLAVIGQIFRNPNFETNRYIFVKDGKIVNITGVTSRLPGSSALFLGKNTEYKAGIDQIKGMMEKSGADGFYMLHNHPSGNAKPSYLDVDVTQHIASEFPGQFNGHVVIDHDTYGLIENGKTAVKLLPIRKPGESTYGTASEMTVPHPLIGTPINSSDALASSAAKLQAEKDTFQIVGTSGSTGEVSGIMSIPVRSLAGAKGLRLAGMLRKFARATGSAQVFAVNIPENTGIDFRRAINTGLLVDAHYAKAGSMMDRGEAMTSVSAESGRVGIKGFRVHAPGAKYDIKEGAKTVADFAAKTEVGMAASEAAGFAASAYDGLQALYRPQGRSAAALEVSREITEGMGGNEIRAIARRGELERAAKDHVARTTLAAKLRDVLDKGLTQAADAVFLRMSKEERYQFMQAMDSDDKSFFRNHPETLQLAGVMKAWWESEADAISQVDPGALQTIRENYFVHIWKKDIPADVLQQMYAAMGKSSSSFEGSKSFTKKRVFQDFNAGIEAGFEPVSDNPLDLFALSIEEMEKYRLAHTTLSTHLALDDGSVLLIGAGEQIPPGFQEVNGRYGTVQRKVEIEDAPNLPSVDNKKTEIKSIRYVAREDVAQVINNYLSKSLYNNKYVGKWFTAYMGAANTLNQFQLGFSLFHAGFTSMEAVISHSALGIEALSKGQVVKAGKYLAQAPFAWATNPALGDHIIKALQNPGLAMGSETGDILEGLKLAGFRWKMDSRLRMDSTKKALTAWSDKRLIATGLHSVGAIVEQSTRPVLEWLVPRQKMGVFGEMYIGWLRDHPSATHEERRNEAQSIWNRVDSRLGQVVYDRLFVHNWAKNAVQMGVRAPGWTGGTVLEVGGGVVDLADYAKKVASGRAKEGLSRRASYVLAMKLVVGLASMVLTKILTGENPKNMKDLRTIRTGKLDENGNPERLVLPTYDKDLYSYEKDFPSSAVTTLSHKMHPALGLVGDMAMNRDYYGTEIHNEDDGFFKRRSDDAKYIGKALTPFAIKGYQKESERGARISSKLLPFIGITPASSDINKTNAEILMSKYGADRLPQGSRKQGDVERSKLKYKIESAVRLHNEKEANRLYNEGHASGMISPDEYIQVRKEAQVGPFALRFKRLTYDQAVQVFDIANKEEKDAVKDIFRQMKAKDDIKQRQRGSVAK
jgi:hypothetical protein